MENTQILSPLNNVLTVKSAAILRTVSKTCKNYIKVKNYSFYKIFKQLNLSTDSVVKMLFEADTEFTTDDFFETFYLPIEYHKFGEKIKEIVLNSEYYWCIMEFAEELIAYNEDDEPDISRLQLACDHCVLYTSYVPLQGLLIELCDTHQF